MAKKDLAKNLSKEAKKVKKKTQKAISNIKKQAKSFQEKESFMEDLLVKNYKEITSKKKNK